MPLPKRLFYMTKALCRESLQFAASQKTIIQNSVFISAAGRNNAYFSCLSTDLRGIPFSSTTISTGI